jgi:hypothetical protein
MLNCPPVESLPLAESNLNLQSNHCRTRIDTQYGIHTKRLIFASLGGSILCVLVYALTRLLLDVLFHFRHGLFQLK